nr:CarD family transcriptional regulator [Beijerinckia sp. L45]
MSAKTKPIASGASTSDESLLRTSVKTVASQAKSKKPPIDMKLEASAATTQSAEGQPERAAPKVVSDAKKVSEPTATSASVKQNQVGKGMVDVSDRKLKKTIESDVVSASAEVAKAEPAKVAKVVGNRQGFKTLEYIVYPAHGVGQITAIEEQEVAGYKLELFVISFAKDKMILKVPTPKVVSVGMRKLAEPPVVKRALDTLMGRARVKRTMWSRRAQEYEAKINSGDLVSIAEVVRDLYRSDAQPEQSYSERQLYEAALDRMAREIAVVQKLTDQEALKVIDDQLQKGPRRVKAEEVDESDADDAEDGAAEGIVEAA